MKRVLTMLFAINMLAGTAPAGSNTAPADYGKVVINSSSQKEGLAPVVFDHWLHRTKYTCKVCHTDIGFAMKAGETGIKAADNMQGMYCGACHNGKVKDSGRIVFAACSTDRTDKARCERCHSQGKSVKRDYDFATVTAKFPKDAFGNGVDWEQAAEDGLVHPADYLEGVSIKQPAQAIQQDFSIKPRAPGKAEIVFSHKKHLNWNGCQTCHPEIFKGGKRGTTAYSMNEINLGKFCGVCHTSVAFPLTDCARCHSKPAK